MASFPINALYPFSCRIDSRSGHIAQAGKSAEKWKIA
jgi:hypothetical protein